MLKTETLHAKYEAVLARESGKASPLQNSLSGWTQSQREFCANKNRYPNYTS